MNVSTTEWAITVFVTVGVIIVDLIIVSRRPHEPKTKELVTFLSFYVGLAVAFGIWTTLYHGGSYGVQFFTGYLTEYSLSIDNLFVFIIIMSALQVPKKYQQEAIMVGIILALVFRTIFIAVGYQLVSNFSWVFYIFGAFLIYTAYGLVKSYKADDSGHDEESAILKFARKRLNVGEEWHGLKLFVKENGKRVATPMLLVLVALGATDIMFALDSIPAIFGITQEPYLVFAANVFALMGLRQLYFLLGGLLQKLVYLSLGLSFILAYIGVKLVIHALHENELSFLNGGEPVISWEIPSLLSLAVIIVTIALTAVLSLRKTKGQEVDPDPTKVSATQSSETDAGGTPDVPSRRTAAPGVEDADDTHR
ncbi:MAG: TerC family protein [Nocardioidaceae bacterium]|nr:TerC family protein [Nocardioidaceae bacterium]